ncbi:hypothetical protein [Futiania mangrovi]|uniref:Uncharacterized protein n=1 Tax=Futiania mangrovi TaxID=2959716 RepID=A0A9J6P9B7_9PROT|nr:hypothetical protein [Futiania mangrovii]MCP1335421.1 hypothetical protein [Futiania mangrovii]
MSEAAVARALKSRFASFGLTHLVVEEVLSIEDGTVNAVLLNTRTQARVLLNVDPETGAIQQGDVLPASAAPCSTDMAAPRTPCIY